MSKASTILPFRFNTWWNHLIPPMVGYGLLARIYFSDDLQLNQLLLFIPLVLGTAAFGYFLNDWTDLEQDAKAGKSNSAAKLKGWQRPLVMGFLIALAWVPLYFMVQQKPLLILLGIQFLALSIYSLPPVRLKERGWPGLLCDMTYGHIVPALFTVFIFFHPREGSESFIYPLLIALIPMLVFKGLRNILVHQLDDRKKDKLSGTDTFITQNRPLAVLNFINRVLIPVEMLTITGLMVFLAFENIHVWPFWLLFLLFTGLNFSFWKFPTLPPRQLKFKFLYFLNDYYEIWFALSVLLWISILDFRWLIFVTVYFIIFPKAPQKLLKDFRKIVQNLKEG